MKRFSSILFLFLINFKCFSQSEDSIVIVEIEHQELKFEKFPTKIKDSSILNFQSSEKGFNLKEFTISPCNSEPDGKMNRISELNYTDGKLNIDVSITANCCGSFLGEIEVLNDSTLNLKYSVYGDECFCACCFTLNYSISSEKNPFSLFKLNGIPIDQTEKVYKSKNIEYEYYENGELKKKIHKYQGEIIGIEYYDLEGRKTKTEYYINGKIIER